MKKRIFAVILTLSLLCSLFLAGCGREPDTIYVGILQVATHTALDNSREGFENRLKEWADENGKKVEFKVKNANGDPNSETIYAEYLKNRKPDLLLGISTSSAKALKGVTTKIPILYTAVTLPEEEGLTSRENVMGTNDLNPVESQIELIKELIPDCKNIAFLYNSSENNSEAQYRMAKKKCDELSINIKKFTASAGNEIQSVVEGIGNEIEAVYVPTDNLMAENIAIICSTLNRKKIPVIAGEIGMCEDGEAAATLGIDYKKLGEQTADMAISILSGVEIADRHQNYCEEPMFYINEENALNAGITKDKINCIKDLYSKDKN